MAKVKWYVSTNRVGSKVEQEFEIDEDYYKTNDDGTVELDERAVDEAVFEAMCQTVHYGWEVAD